MFDNNKVEFIQHDVYTEIKGKGSNEQWRQHCQHEVGTRSPTLLQPRLEPMKLDRGLGDTLFYEERGYLGPLVTLELDDLTHLVIVDKSAIASEFLP
jgi:hypothetical protein